MFVFGKDELRFSGRAIENKSSIYGKIQFDIPTAVKPFKF